MLRRRSTRTSPVTPSKPRLLLATWGCQVLRRRWHASSGGWPELLIFPCVTRRGEHLHATQQVLAAQDFYCCLERRLRINDCTVDIQKPLTRLVPFALAIAGPAEGFIEQFFQLAK